MADTTAPQPRRRNRAATRGALLDAARLRFSRQGFDATGVREIASDAGVDPALVFRYFGSKEKLYTEAMCAYTAKEQVVDRQRPLSHLTDSLLREIVHGDWQEFDGEHPLLVMLRSSARPAVREQLCSRLWESQLADVTDRLDGEDAALRAEMIGALLLGMGVMRSVVGSPALGEASFEQTRALVGRLVRVLAEGDAPTARPHRGRRAPGSG
ncbi:TetR family transcriptional regulator [Streptomyces sp. CAU 1734]|uniref:TetR/AcrR family transcriptional regulator n=1 Tax=Streptomyces sp. CAU 1734 TaxID=3140360 RepID=UPI003260DA79